MPPMYDEEDPRPVRQGHSVVAAFFTSLITTAVAFAALTAADARGMLPFLHGGAREAEVPSIVGVSVEQARDLLAARGLLLTLQAERPDPVVDKGKIAGQVPLAGSRAATATAVQAFVSSGAGLIAVPVVTGSRPDDAIEQLRNRKLLAGPRREAASDTVAAGLVIETDPPAARTVNPDTAVALIVSTGPAAKVVPKVVGLRASKAKKALEEAGFKVGKMRYGSNDDYDESVILKQAPEPNTPAAPGTLVDLVVNE
jgi:eukaryotic-like serine/threonine-protein kinase